MLTEIRIYCEGHPRSKPALRKFFRLLHERARDFRCSFEIIPSGSGAETCRNFERALRTHPEALSLLLIDSEGPNDRKLWKDLREKYRLDRGTQDSVFWMIEMMEAWFHADKAALKSFYREGFREDALKQNPNVELIPKADLTSGLHAATKNTRKGSYVENKRSHSSALLEIIDAAKVRDGSEQCERLFSFVQARLESVT